MQWLLLCLELFSVGLEMLSTPNSVLLQMDGPHSCQVLQVTEQGGGKRAVSPHQSPA